MVFAVKNVFNFNCSLTVPKTSNKSVKALSNMAELNFFFPYNCDSISVVIGKIDEKT